MLTGKANLQSLPIQKHTAPSVPHSHIGRNDRDRKQSRVGQGKGRGDAVVDMVHKGPCDGTLEYSDWSGVPPKVIKLHTQTCRRAGEI